MTDWIITIPKTTSWVEYTKELDRVRDGKEVLNYRLSRDPRNMFAGDRMFIVWSGRVRGWMKITGINYIKEGFHCTTTGRFWEPGYYVQRSGPFHAIHGEEYRGFQGYRRYPEGDKYEVSDEF